MIPMDAAHARAFTLIELLVVVTIIVVLLALIAPAMDAAIYRAELTICATNQKGIASAMTVYATGHNRFLPYNKSLANNTTWHAPLIKLASANNDMRQVLSPYLPLQKILFDPMIKPQDIETDAIAQMYGNYSLWNFWKWAPAVDPNSRAQRKLGDRFTYYDGVLERQYSWDVLACDFMRAVNPMTDGKYWTNHPTKSDTSSLFRTAPGAANQYTFWISTVPKRDLVDFNVARQDGSVETLADVEADDERLAHPTEFNTSRQTGLPGLQAEVYHQMPVK